MVMSKGSTRREPIDYVQFCRNWEKIFDMDKSRSDKHNSPVCPFEGLDRQAGEEGRTGIKKTKPEGG